MSAAQIRLLGLLIVWLVTIVLFQNCSNSGYNTMEISSAGSTDATNPDSSNQPPRITAPVWGNASQQELILVHAALLPYLNANDPSKDLGLYLADITAEGHNPKLISVDTTQVAQVSTWQRFRLLIFPVPF